MGRPLSEASEEKAIEAVEEASEDKALTVLVTAGTSGIGLALTKTLIERGHKVYADADTAAGAATLREIGGFPTYLDQTRAGEITSALKMSQADVIVSLDPLVADSVPFQAKNWDADRLRATAEALVEGVQALGDDAPFVVVPSFAFLYGESDAPVAEDASLRSADGNSLLQAALDAERTVTTSGLNYTLLRAGYIYGPHDEAMTSLFETLRAGRPISTGDGHANWIHNEDLANALALIIEQQPTGEVFNLVDDKPASPAAFMEQFASMMGIQVPEGFLLRLGRLFSGGMATTLLDLDAQASNAKAKEALGWQPRYPDHEAGLAQTLLTWRAEA